MPWPQSASSAVRSVCGNAACIVWLALADIRACGLSLGLLHTADRGGVLVLERELGHRLLDRAPGQQAIQPTAYGQKVVAAIRAASATRPTNDVRPHRSRKMPRV